MSRTRYVHSEDLDGWLTESNHPIPPGAVRFLAGLQGLETPDGAHRIEVVLNSGKPGDYLLREARRFGGRTVIGGNGAFWQREDEEPCRIAPGGDDYARLRAILGLTPDETDVVTLSLHGRRVEVALEGKRDGQGDMAISFFPEAEPVAHRWRFRQGTERRELHAVLTRLVREHGLALSVPEPHPDGAIDLLPLLEGRPVGKWTLGRMAEHLFPGDRLHLTHAGNGLNDLCAMELPEITPCTASNCAELIAVVERRRGVVTRSEAPHETPIVECCAVLAARGHYGPLSEAVARLCAAHQSGQPEMCVSWGVGGKVSA